MHFEIIIAALYVLIMIPISLSLILTYIRSGDFVEPLEMITIILVGILWPTLIVIAIVVLLKFLYEHRGTMKRKVVGRYWTLKARLVREGNESPIRTR